MKQFYLKLATTAMLFIFFQGVHAQTYRYALKFNYGVFNYNDKTSEAIKQPLDRPFSLGGQFQSNFSKAFTNSIGFNTYKWGNNSSYNIQEMLFLRNNASLLSRFKPQIGFGVGFEESKIVANNVSSYKQYAYIPVNIGLQTDLSNRISLGIFGEVKYGFDLKNFDINNGGILPNNTAGISIAYRFSKVKERAVYPEINWDKSESLISVPSLKKYQNKKLGIDSNINNPFLSPLSVSTKGKNTFLFGDSLQQVTKMKALQPILVADSITYYKDSTGKIVMRKRVEMDTIFKQNLSIGKGAIVNKNDSLTLFSPQIAGENQAGKAGNVDYLTENEISSNFDLSDFTETTTDTIYLINQIADDLSAEAQANQPQPQIVTYTPNQTENQSYTVPQNNYEVPRTVTYNNTYPPAQTVNYARQNPQPVQAVTRPSNTTTSFQAAETASGALLNAQLGKLINLQTKTLALLVSQSKINPDSAVSIMTDQPAIDSLRLRIAALEKRLSTTQKIDTVKIIEPINNTVQAKPVSFLPILCMVSYAVNETNLSDSQRNIIINNIFKPYQLSIGKKISLASFTDNSGSASYNKKLSDMRLKRAVQFLSVLGVKAEDIETKSYGESEASEVQNPEERRLEIKLIEK